jgi:membrane protein implicated in regulation of membrane protease activity
MKPKTLGWIQILAAIIAVGYMLLQNTTWNMYSIAILIYGIVFLIMGWHHLSEKKARHR